MYIILSIYLIRYMLQQSIIHMNTFGINSDEKKKCRGTVPVIPFTLQ